MVAGWSGRIDGVDLRIGRLQGMLGEEPFVVPQKMQPPPERTD